MCGDLTASVTGLFSVLAVDSVPFSELLRFSFGNGDFEMLVLLFSLLGLDDVVVVVVEVDDSVLYCKIMIG